MRLLTVRHQPDLNHAKRITTGTAVVEIERELWRRRGEVIFGDER
jgi:hypothetical protein